MATMRAAFAFYRNFIWIANAISIFGCFTILLNGKPTFIIPVFWMKICTNILLGIYVNVFQDEQFYFYYNLGFTRKRLFALAFAIDLSVWICMTLLTLILLQ